MGLYYLCSKNKDADQLTSAFVFAYAKSRFSHHMAHMDGQAVAQLVCVLCVSYK